MQYNYAYNFNFNTVKLKWLLLCINIKCPLRLSHDSYYIAGSITKVVTKILTLM